MLFGRAGSSPAFGTKLKRLEYLKSLFLVLWAYRLLKIKGCFLDRVG